MEGGLSALWHFAPALSQTYADIESVLSAGSEFMIQMQAQGEWLRTVSRFLSYLGDDIAYIAALPMVVVLLPGICVQVFVLFFVNLYVNAVLKTLLHAPQPSWVSTQGFVCEIEYGNPSGHAQNATALDSAWLSCPMA